MNRYLGICGNPTWVLCLQFFGPVSDPSQVFVQ